MSCVEMIWEYSTRLCTVCSSSIKTMKEKTAAAAASNKNNYKKVVTLNWNSVVWESQSDALIQSTQSHTHRERERVSKWNKLTLIKTINKFNMTFIYDIFTIHSYPLIYTHSLHIYNVYCAQFVFFMLLFVFGSGSNSSSGYISRSYCHFCYCHRCCCYQYTILFWPFINQWNRALYLICWLCLYAQQQPKNHTHKKVPNAWAWADIDGLISKIVDKISFRSIFNHI